MPLPTAVGENVTSLLDLFTYANTATDMIFWQLMLVTVFIVAFITLNSKNTLERSLAASGFLTGMIGSFLFVLGLIQLMPLLISLAVAIGSFVLLLTTKE